MLDNQPIDSPEVVFEGPVPKHEHVYSNGFICLSILYDGGLISMECSHERIFGLLFDYFNASECKSQGFFNRKYRKMTRNFLKDQRGKDQRISRGLFMMINVSNV